MSEPFVVRPATVDDVDALVDAYEAVASEGRWIGGEAPVDREAATSRRIRDIEDPHALVLLAEASGRVIAELGISAESHRPAVGYLGMHVAADWRGRGVGAALLEAAIAWAREQKMIKIALYVWPHNEAAIRLYEKLGFQREGYHPKHYRRRNGDYWDVISMGLLL